MRDFDPVHLPEGLRPDERASQTLLGRFNVCPRSAYLYALHGGGPGSHPMDTGSAGHKVIEQAQALMLRDGESSIPAEVVKDLCNGVLADPQFRVPVENHDFLRESVYRWAEALRSEPFDPESVVAIESLLVLDVDGFQVRGKVDQASVSRDGGHATVRDWKFSRAPAAWEEIGRRRPDGTLAAKSFQLVTYALLLAFGRPVGEDGTPEPVGLAEHAQDFTLELVYPGVRRGRDDDRPAVRGVTLTRLELHEYLESLRGLVARLRATLDSGRWDPVPGSHCSECAAPAECPIPRRLRNFEGVESEEQARAELEWAERTAALVAARRKSANNWLKAREIPLRIGADQVAEVVYTPRQEMKRVRGKTAWAEFTLAVERATELGEPFDIADWLRESGSSTVKIRKLSEDELQP